MAEASDTTGIVYQILVDAGCKEQDIRRCVGLAETGAWARMLPILREHRKCLLDQVHTVQEKIDCLDFLIYQLNKDHNDDLRKERKR